MINKRYQRRVSTMQERAKRGVTIDQIDDEPMFVYILTLDNHDKVELSNIEANIGCTLKLLEDGAFSCYTTATKLRREERVTWFTEFPWEHRISLELKDMINNQASASTLAVSLAQDISNTATTEEDASRYRGKSRKAYEETMALDLLQRIEEAARTQIGVSITTTTPQSDRIIVDILYPLSETVESKADIFKRVVQFFAQQTFVVFVEKEMTFSIMNNYASKVGQSGLNTPYITASKSIYQRGITGTGQVCSILFVLTV